MTWRLPSVLAAMALILAMGVLSVRHLESHVGATVVRGVVLVALPELAERETWPLAARWRGVASMVEPGESPATFAPFDDAWVASWTAAGGSAVLLHAGEPGAGDALRATWPVVVQDAGPDAVNRLARSAADFLAAQHGTRAFVLGIDLREARETRTGALLDELVPAMIAALEGLPSFRATALVVLGPADPAGGRRPALRLDRGRWSEHPLPDLADLLRTDP
jgi:hypothetical protein